MAGGDAKAGRAGGLLFQRRVLFGLDSHAARRFPHTRLITGGIAVIFILCAILIVVRPNKLFSIEHATSLQSAFSQCLQGGSPAQPKRLIGPLDPICMRASELSAPDGTLKVTRSFAEPEREKVAFHLFVRNARNISVLSVDAVFYARLLGPALVVGEQQEEVQNGTVTFLFDVPFPGKYRLDVWLLYDSFAHQLAAWNSAEFNPDDITACLTNCHNSGPWNVPLGPSEDYEGCMNVCREHFGGPLLVEQRKSLEGLEAVGDSDILKHNDVCGVEGHPDQRGFWVNATLLCGDPNAALGLDRKWLKCRQSVMLCPTSSYSNSKERLCNNSIAWRPLTCRHASWSSGKLPHGAAEGAQLKLRSLQESINFCGDSTTGELQKIWKDTFPKPNGKQYNRSCLSPGKVENQILFMGSCGDGDLSTPALASQQKHKLVQYCVERIAELPQIARWKILIWKANPSTHPYTGPSIDWKFHGYHGQRMFLTAKLIQEYNRELLEILERAGIRDKRFYFLDEFAMTEAARGFSTDALHYFYNVRGDNLVFVYSVMNSIATLLVRAMQDGLLEAPISA